jgi:hypothetical protein
MLFEFGGSNRDPLPDGPVRSGVTSKDDDGRPPPAELWSLDEDDEADFSLCDLDQRRYPPVT